MTIIILTEWIARADLLFAVLNIPITSIKLFCGQNATFICLMIEPLYLLLFKDH